VNEQEAGEENSEVYEKIVIASMLHLKHPSGMWCKLIFTLDLEVRQNVPDQLMINQLFRTLHAITHFLEVSGRSRVVTIEAMEQKMCTNTLQLEFVRLRMSLEQLTYITSQHIYIFLHNQENIFFYKAGHKSSRI